MCISIWCRNDYADFGSRAHRGQPGGEDPAVWQIQRLRPACASCIHMQSLCARPPEQQPGFVVVYKWEERSFVGHQPDLLMRTAAVTAHYQSMHAAVKMLISRIHALHSLVSQMQTGELLSTVQGA